MTLFDSICSILFASSVNSLIPPAPQFNVVQALWPVQSKKYKNQHCFGGKGEKCDQNAQKSNFTTKCINTFVAYWYVFHFGNYHYKSSNHRKMDLFSILRHFSCYLCLNHHLITYLYFNRLSSGGKTEIHTLLIFQDYHSQSLPMFLP